MKKIKFSKENISLGLIVILSGILSFWNLGIEGYANKYYTAAVKSMTMSFKNFFFAAFDPSGFVSIDKPPLGYWLQAISAKIFGFSTWSILLPQALAGVISVILIYHIVKKSFGSAAGLISALCLAVTPVFVAVSRNNTVDNVLVMVLLFACWAMTIAAEKGKLKYLIISLVLVGVGFNVKMLQAYLIVPALYITYLLSTGTSLKKRLFHLVLATAILAAVSLSWALIVDSVPAGSRPYVDSSTNNTVMELILGHNGAERLSFGSSSNSGGGAPGGNASFSKDGQNMPSNPPGGSSSGNMPGNTPSGNSGDGGMQNGNMPGNPPNGGGFGGGNASQGLSGTFGGQTAAGLTRLFSKNILSDQIVWFIPLAFIGFIAAAIREKLKFRLDNKKKQALVLWFMWFLPEFIYFSFNTGTFHSYYLTMLAPPIAALAGIGLVSMWQSYKEGGWKSWFLPAALLANGVIQFIMLTYFSSYSSLVKLLMILLVVLCFGSSILLLMLKLTNVNESEWSKNFKLKRYLVCLALAGLLIIPFAGSSTVLFTQLNGSFPAAGLELLSSSSAQAFAANASSGGGTVNSSNSKLIEFLEKNKTASQKYLLVVSSSNDASDIIIKTGEPVMAIGGFLGSDKSITLDEFKALVKKGEIRYVMTGGNGGSSGGGSTISEIMSWVEQNGTAVSESEYSDSAQIADHSVNQLQSAEQTEADSASESENSRGFGGFGGRGTGQLYDLKAYTDSLSTK